MAKLKAQMRGSATSPSEVEQMAKEMTQAELILEWEVEYATNVKKLQEKANKARMKYKKRH